MDFDNQSMTLEEAMTIIREINPIAEETNSRRAETLILQAVHYCPNCGAKMDKEEE